MEPAYSPVQQIENFLVFVCPLLAGARVLIFYPIAGIATIRIDRNGQFMFFAVCQGMNNGEEFDDIVGAFFKRALLKNYLPCFGVDSLIFRSAGTGIPGTINSDAFEDWIAKYRPLSVSRYDFDLGFSDKRFTVATEGLFCQLSGWK